MTCVTCGEGSAGYHSCRSCKSPVHNVGRGCSVGDEDTLICVQCARPSAQVRAPPVSGASPPVPHPYASSPLVMSTGCTSPLSYDNNVHLKPVRKPGVSPDKKKARKPGRLMLKKTLQRRELADTSPVSRNLGLGFSGIDITE